ncbi:MAG: hypothetical protein WAT36_04555, partial [Chromatiaceae bacterium]
EQKTGKTATVHGVTRHTRDTADAARVLGCHRAHWTVANGCHDTLDWHWDEDRCSIRTDHGPANITALRRCVIGAIKAQSRDTVSATRHPPPATRQRLARRVRLGCDYPRMTENSRRRPRGRPAAAG